MDSSASSTTTTTTTTTTRLYPRLMSWITENGGDCTKVDIRTTERAGRGLFANCNLNTNDVIFQIPKICLISETSLKNSLSGIKAMEHAKKKGFQVPPRILMSIHLMAERAACVERTRKANVESISVESVESVSSSTSGSSSSFATKA